MLNGRPNKHSWQTASHSFAYQVSSGQLKKPDRVKMTDTILTMVGRRVTLGLVNGVRYEGILDSLDPFNGNVVLQQARLLSVDQHKPGGPIKFLLIEGKDVESLVCSGIKKEQQKQFQTDTAISGHQQQKERRLERWMPTGDEIELEPSTDGPWDQFKANEQLFGVDTDFDEGLYTTKVDKSGPDFHKREQEAARLAREIEQKATSNPHLAEERGQQVADEDEESKYSSVIRKEKSKPPLNRPEDKKPPVKPDDKKVAQKPTNLVQKPTFAKIVDNKTKADNPKLQQEVAKEFKHYATEEKKNLEKKMKELKLNEFKKFSSDIAAKLPLLSKREEEKKQEKQEEPKKEQKPAPKPKQEPVKPTPKPEKPEKSEKPEKLDKTEKVEKQEKTSPSKARSEPSSAAMPEPEKEEKSEDKPKKKAFAFNAAASEFTPTFNPYAVAYQPPVMIPITDKPPQMRYPQGPKKRTGDKKKGDPNEEDVPYDANMQPYLGPMVRPYMYPPHTVPYLVPQPGYQPIYGMVQGARPNFQQGMMYPPEVMMMYPPQEMIPEPKQDESSQ
ncbi:LsmAD domain-containing protein [Gorgonomyces haynaldii]|nr:LsmAD domain-containing protein [Gorgonomyces haynaldii]